MVRNAWGFALVFALVSSSSWAAGDTLRIGHYDMPAQFGLPYGTFGSNGALPLHAVFDAFVYVDARGKPSPGLALSWEARSSDTWVFKLRPNVRFHNDELLTSSVIAANVEALLSDPAVQTQQVARQIDGLAGARVIDELTVEIRTTRPDAILPKRLALMRPHEPKAWKELGPDQYGRRPIGTGAYQIDEWSRERILGKAFRAGWRKTRIPKLEIIALPETAARVQALNSAQVDIAWLLPPDAKASVEAAGNRIVSSQTNNTLNLILLHTKKESPVSDVRVRRALNYAFDKNTFIQTMLRGTTVATGQPAAPGMVGYFADIKPYPYDPGRAKQLLAEAGYPQGLKLTAEIVVALGEFKDTMEAMANDFKKVGVDLELRVVTIPDFVRRVLGVERWAGDAFSMQYEGYPSSDLTRIMNTHSCLSRQGARQPHTCFEDIMGAINAANSTFDEQEREKLLRQIAQYYHDNASAVFSHQLVQLDGLSPKVRNYRMENRVVNFDEIDLVD